MSIGIVKAINEENGLGYILKSDGSEIFMVIKGLEDKLKEGIPVEFDIKQTRVGVVAINVHPRLDNATA